MLTKLFAQDIPEAITLRGSGIATGASIEIKDPYLTNTPENLVRINQKAVVRLHIDPDMITDWFEYDLTLRIYNKLNPDGTFDNSVSYTKTLSVENNFNGNVGDYVDLQLHEISNSYGAKIVIEDTFTNNISKMQSQFVSPANAVLTLSYVPEYYFKLDTNKVVIFGPGMVNPSEYLISWDEIPGAFEYQLEWTWIDNYSDEVDTTTKEPKIIPEDKLPLTVRDFELNNTRVLITKTEKTQTNFSYSIPLIYSRGHLIYRIRAVGRFLETEEDKKSLSNILYGKWNNDPNAEFVSNWKTISNKFNHFSTHEKQKNWQFQASYAENGKKKEVVSYFDGTLRNRQTVTKINTSNDIVVGEVIYDNQGRPAVEVLPVPTGYNELTYYSNFNKNLQNNIYSHLDFDWDNGANNCGISLSGMGTEEGASKYYSPNNDVSNDYQDYVPNAFNYPFSQIEYTPDNTGRIRRKGGVGPNHQLGTNNEMKYFYSQPNNSFELNRLFGYHVGDLSHYKKNLVVDPNGQTSISYLDPQGRTIATALAGGSPDNLNPLEDLSKPIHKQINSNLLYNNESYATGRYKLIKDALKVSKQITSPENNTDYTFLYKLTKNGVFNIDSCSFQTPFKYDLKLDVIDDCGLSMLTKDPLIKGISLKGIEEYAMPTNEGIKTKLNTGEYSVVKNLIVNKDAIDDAWEEYYTQATTDGGCLLSDDAFITFEIECGDIDCEVINQGKTAYYTIQLESRVEFKNNYTINNNEEIIITTQDEVLKAKMEAFANGLVESFLSVEDFCKVRSICETDRDMLISDLNPGGQYANDKLTEIDDPDSDNSEDKIYVVQDKSSIFDPNNLLYINNTNGGKNWRTPHYVDEYNAEGYFDLNGELSKIEIKEQPGLENTDWLPKILDNATKIVEGGKTFVKPQDLKYVEDFIKSWKPNWAKSLVKYHPEYCYLEYSEKLCEKETTIQVNSENKTMNSREFDEYLNSIETYEDAVNANLLVNNQSIVSIDPFFNNNIANDNLQNMRKSIMDYALTKHYAGLIKNLGANDKFGIIAYSYAVVKNGSLLNTQSVSNIIDKDANSILSLAASNFSTKKKNEFWLQYLNTYLGLKNAIYDVCISMHAVTNGCFNSCLEGDFFGDIITDTSGIPNENGVDVAAGDIDTTPSHFAMLVKHYLDVNVSGQTVRDIIIANHLSAPSNTLCATKDTDEKNNLYKEKVKRFGTSFAFTPNEILKDNVDVLNDIASDDYYIQTGKCKSQLELEIFLRHFFKERTTINAVSASTPFSGNYLATTLYEQFGGVETEAHNLSVGTSGTGKELNFNFSGIANPKCTTPIKLSIPTLSNAPQGKNDINWSGYGNQWVFDKNIGLTEFYYDEETSIPTSNVYNFKILATIIYLDNDNDDTNNIKKEYVFNGTTCADLLDCLDCEGDCDKNYSIAIKNELKLMLNKALDNGFVNGNVNATIAEIPNLYNFFEPGEGSTINPVFGKSTNGKTLDFQLKYSNPTSTEPHYVFNNTEYDYTNAANDIESFTDVKINTINIDAQNYDFHDVQIIFKKKDGTTVVDNCKLVLVRFKPLEVCLDDKSIVGDDCGDGGRGIQIKEELTGLLYTFKETGSSGEIPVPMSYIPEIVKHFGYSDDLYAGTYKKIDGTTTRFHIFAENQTNGGGYFDIILDEPITDIHFDSRISDLRFIDFNESNKRHKIVFKYRTEPPLYEMKIAYGYIDYGRETNFNVCIDGPVQDCFQYDTMRIYNDINTLLDKVAEGNFVNNTALNITPEEILTLYKFYEPSNGATINPVFEKINDSSFRIDLNISNHNLDKGLGVIEFKRLGNFFSSKPEKIKINASSDYASVFYQGGIPVKGEHIVPVEIYYDQDSPIITKQIDVVNVEGTGFSCPESYFLEFVLKGQNNIYAEDESIVGTYYRDFKFYSSKKFKLNELVDFSFNLKKISCISYEQGHLLEFNRSDSELFMVVNGVEDRFTKTNPYSQIDFGETDYKSITSDFDESQHNLANTGNANSNNLGGYFADFDMFHLDYSALQYGESSEEAFKVDSNTFNFNEGQNLPVSLEGITMNFKEQWINTPNIPKSFDYDGVAYRIEGTEVDGDGFGLSPGWKPSTKFGTFFFVGDDDGNAISIKVNGKFRLINKLKYQGPIRGYDRLYGNLINLTFGNSFPELAENTTVYDSKSSRGFMCLTLMVNVVNKKLIGYGSASKTTKIKDCECIVQQVEPVSCNEEWETFYNYFNFQDEVINYDDGTSYIATTSTKIPGYEINKAFLNEENFCGLNLNYITADYLKYLEEIQKIRSITSKDELFLTITEFGNTKLNYGFNKTQSDVIPAFIAYYNSIPQDQSAKLWRTYVNEEWIPNQEKLCLPRAMIGKSTIKAPEPKDICDYLKESITNSYKNYEYQKYITETKKQFERSYIEQAINNANEQFTMQYDDKEYQYTLYYYDQAGNLIQTVPPKGVNRLGDNLTTAEKTTLDNQIQAVKKGAAPNKSLRPDHKMQTKYRYNSLNQLVWQKTPDGGITQFAYDDLGRIIASQNAKQIDFQYYIDNDVQLGFIVNSMSYTNYDALGRIVEAGEILFNENEYTINEEGKLIKNGVTAPQNNFDLLLNDTNALVAVKRQVTQTIYNNSFAIKPDGTLSSSLFKNFDYSTTRNRVTGIKYFDEFKHSKYNKTAFNNALLYNYDIHGNVKELITYINDDRLRLLNKHIKSVQYNYDLISGNVNQVTYQEGDDDQFIHKYNYDADNRITSVQTSSDGIIWETDANYQYYKHGPLARVLLGNKKVQNLDYVYTLQGWLKGVNSENLYNNNDASNNQDHVAQDAFGFALSYFNNDYNSRTGVNPFAETASHNQSIASSSLFNGNIRGMTTSLLNTNEQAINSVFNNYKYDQLNRISSMTSNQVSGLNPTGAKTEADKTSYKYDSNGNLTHLNRANTAGEFDKLTYDYFNEIDPATYEEIEGRPSNRLKIVTDRGDSNIADNDIENHTNNYEYDAIGQLISDPDEGINTIEWRADGKVKQIEKNNLKIAFQYDGLGNRLSKTIIENDKPTTTYYIRDAQGNVLSVYESKDDSDGTVSNSPIENLTLQNGTITTPEGVKLASKTITVAGATNTYTIQQPNGQQELIAGQEITLKNGFTAQEGSNFLARIDNVNATPTNLKLTLKEQHIYGSSRLGLQQPNKLLAKIGNNQRQDPTLFSNTVGDKRYELSNHLGNVLAVITDRKLTSENNGNVQLKPDVVAFNDYYPFGMLIPGRNASSSSYRYGFQGQEKDDEIKGEGNSINYKFRMHDPRVGRFFAVDPLFKQYAHNSPYSFSENRVIDATELEGLEKSLFHVNQLTEHFTGRKVPTEQKVKVDVVQVIDDLIIQPTITTATNLGDVSGTTLTLIARIPYNIRYESGLFDDSGPDEGKDFRVLTTDGLVPFDQKLQQRIKEQAVALTAEGVVSIATGGTGKVLANGGKNIVKNRLKSELIEETLESADEVVSVVVKNTDDLISTSTKVSKEGSKVTRFDRAGTYDDAVREFKQLQNVEKIEKIETQYGTGYSGKLKEGGTISVRPSSKKSSSPTIQMNPANSGKGQKTVFRYNGKPQNGG